MSGTFRAIKLKLNCLYSIGPLVVLLVVVFLVVVVVVAVVVVDIVVVVDVDAVVPKHHAVQVN